MKFKKIFLITLLLLTVFTISSVSATNNEGSNDIISIENLQNSNEQITTINLEEDLSENLLNNGKNSEILGLDTEITESTLKSNVEAPLISSPNTEVLGASVPKKAQVKIYAPQVTVKYKTNSYFKISVKDYYGKPAKQVYLNVFIDNGKMYYPKTDNNGIAKINTKNLKIRTYEVEISYYDTDYNYDVRKVSKIIVKKTIPKKTTKKKTTKKKTSAKSIILKVRYSSYPVTKKLKNRDVIATNYEKYSGRQYNPGVYAEVSYGGGLEKAKHTKLIKCIVWFKNANGKIAVKSSSKVYYNWFIKVGLKKGYTPYKAKIWYKTF